MKVRVRDDDVLVASVHYKSVFARFVRIHEIIVNNGGIHVPSIMCAPIMDHPECIEYIKHESVSHRMLPELHCLDHVDYGILSKEELDDNLRQCVTWFKDYLGMTPSIFYPPWGSNSPLLQEVAAKYGLTVVDCSNLVRPRDVVMRPRGHKDCKELFIHWWNKSDRRNLEQALKILGEGNAR